MYLTSAALANLRSCLLQSASSYIATKVSVIASLTLGVVPMQLFRLGTILHTRNPKWSTSLAAIKKITAVQTSLVAATLVCSWRTRAEHAQSKLYTPLRRKDAQLLESSQANHVAPPVVLQTLVPSIMGIQSQLG